MIVLHLCGLLTFLLHTADLLASTQVSMPEWLDSLHVHALGTDVSILAAAVVAACTLLMLGGVKSASRINMAVTCLNLAVLTFVVAAGATQVTPCCATSFATWMNCGHACCNCMPCSACGVPKYPPFTRLLLVAGCHNPPVGPVLRWKARTGQLSLAL